MLEEEIDVVYRPILSNKNKFQMMGKEKSFAPTGIDANAISK